ncbi:MAG TPA: hypothetical protein VFD92_15885 [Candidatus Binatia bacterium]|nr:hypothetical protein [Candidatus Binatia bacterium]
MTVDEFEQHVQRSGLVVERLTVGGQIYLHLNGVRIAGGRHSGTECEVAILRTTEVPWAPEAAVHVRPHLVTMGQMNSQTSPVGSDWQYLSRRFDKPGTPKNFLAHILKVLAET